MSWNIANIDEKNIIKSGFKSPEDALAYIKEHICEDDILEKYTIFKEEYEKRSNRK